MLADTWVILKSFLKIQSSGMVFRYELMTLVLIDTCGAWQYRH